MNRMFCALGLAVLVANPAAFGESTPPITYYVQLVWGTNQQAPERAPFRAVGQKLKRRLSRCFRWTNYWEINSQAVTVAAGTVQKVTLSQDCKIEIQSTSSTTREVRLYRNDKLVRKSRADVRSNGMSIHGGDTTADGAWFVVIRRDKPRYP
ncbi:MAG: hypothetical protein KGS61_02870 [Verrucomicrobia bacterium]|nr:hypothetical protein [Verrucomicrobiota bacterium]